MLNMMIIRTLNELCNTLYVEPFNAIMALEEYLVHPAENSGVPDYFLTYYSFEKDYFWDRIPVIY